MSEKLEACPFCESDKVEFTPNEEQHEELDTTTGFIWCHGCGFSSDSFYSEAIAAAHWNRRPAPEANEALTLEELHALTGKQPLYIVDLKYHSDDRWIISIGWDASEEELGNTEGDAWSDWNYGTEWLAYRRPPDGGEG